MNINILIILYIYIYIYIYNLKIIFIANGKNNIIYLILHLNLYFLNYDI